MATARRPSDEVSIHIYVPIVVSDTRWRATRRSKGVNMTGVVTAADVAAYFRAAIEHMVIELGVAPDPPKKKK